MFANKSGTLKLQILSCEGHNICNGSNHDGSSSTTIITLPSPVQARGVKFVLLKARRGDTFEDMCCFQILLTTTMT